MALPVALAVPVASLAPDVVRMTLLEASAADSALAPAASIVRVSGSSSHVPVSPCAADVSMVNPLKSTVLPDVSISPPLPLTPCARAKRLAVPVRLSPSTLRCPALPLVELTLIVPPS